jgi:hypothetical protein
MIVSWRRTLRGCVRRYQIGSRQQTDRVRTSILQRLTGELRTGTQR